MLSVKAQKLVRDYLSLPFADIKGVRCPYFNNTRLKQRGQLRALVGKGTPQEIVEEAKIVSIQYHHQVFDKTGHCCLHDSHEKKDSGQIAKDVTRFLVEKQLGNRMFRICHPGFTAALFRES